MLTISLLVVPRTILSSNIKRINVTLADANKDAVYVYGWITSNVIYFKVTDRVDTPILFSSLVAPPATGYFLHVSFLYLT